MEAVFDLNVLTIASTIAQVNATSVVTPALNSLNSFFAQVMSAIPRVIAGGIVLLIGYIIGRGVGWAYNGYLL